MYLSELAKTLTFMSQRLGPDARVHMGGYQIEAIATDGFDLELQTEDLPSLNPLQRATDMLNASVKEKKDSDINGDGH